MKKQTILLTALLTAATLPQQLLSQSAPAHPAVSHHVKVEHGITESGHSGGTRSASAHSAVVTGNPGTGVAQKNDASQKNDAKSVTQLFGTPKEVNKPDGSRSIQMLKGGQTIAFTSKSGYSYKAAMGSVEGGTLKDNIIFIAVQSAVDNKKAMIAKMLSSFGLSSAQSKEVMNGKAVNFQLADEQGRKFTYAVTGFQDGALAKDGVFEISVKGKSDAANETTLAGYAIASILHHIATLGR